MCDRALPDPDPRALSRVCLLTSFRHWSWAHISSSVRCPSPPSRAMQHRHPKVSPIKLGGQELRLLLTPLHFSRVGPHLCLPIPNRMGGRTLWNPARPQLLRENTEDAERTPQGLPSHQASTGLPASWGPQSLGPVSVLTPHLRPRHSICGLHAACFLP